MDETKFFNEILIFEKKADEIDQKSLQDVLIIKENSKREIELLKKELSDSLNEYLLKKQKELDNFTNEFKLNSEKRLKKVESEILMKKEKIFPEIINQFLKNLFEDNIS
jgi:gas vesicle protein